jgi:glutamate/tyrosine decarboxylase-like PLP-dependent enzyme
VFWQGPGAGDLATAVAVPGDLTSPVGCALERITARWITDVPGLPGESRVSYVTGATMGTFTALAAARDALLRRAGHDALTAGLWNAPRLRVVTGDEVHVTVVKALTLLGFGSAEIERVPTDDQGRVRPDALPDLDDRTILILQAGNVNSGAIDPFDQVVPRARRAGAWVHVDGAFGLWAAASPALRGATAGIEDADSWVTDGHKWLNTPYDCGLAIVRDAQALHQAMATQAPYLVAGTTAAPKDMGPEFSRSARAVEVWAALYSLGRQGVAELIDRTCAHARAFANGLHGLGYTVLNDVTLNQVVAAPPGDPNAAGRIAARVQESGEWVRGDDLAGMARDPDLGVEPRDERRGRAPQPRRYRRRDGGRTAGAVTGPTPPLRYAQMRRGDCRLPHRRPHPLRVAARASSVRDPRTGCR